MSDHWESQGARSALEVAAAERGDAGTSAEWACRRLRAWAREPRAFSGCPPEIVEEAGTVDIASHPLAASILRVEMTGELLGLAPELEERLPTACALHLVIRDGMGGSLSAAGELLRLVEAIHPACLRLTVQGRCASAHGFLAAAWPGRRTMDAGATLTFHTPVLFCFGDAGRIRQEASRLETLTSEWTLRLARRCGRPVREVARWLRPGADATFAAPAAVEAGLADEISGEPSPG